MKFVSLFDSIPELLYKHNCVIIPGFGGFITNYKESGFEENRNLINPPCKRVAFNQSLKENDGLLVNYWSRFKGVPYKDALDDVESFCNYLKERIAADKSFDFKHIGTFYLNAENNIIFVPYQGLNFLDSSFGLYPVKIKPLQLSVPVGAVQNTQEIKIPDVIIADNSEKQRPVKKARVSIFRNPGLLKAASVLLFLTFVGFSGWYFLNTKPDFASKQKKQSEQKASLFNTDSNFEQAAPIKKNMLIEFEYKAEHQKLDAIKSELDSFAVKSSSNVESYNVVIGYFDSEARAKYMQQKLSADYVNARVGEETESGFCVIVETFYKHTTANTFSVMLKQNGYTNISIEKQVVLE